MQYTSCRYVSSVNRPGRRLWRSMTSPCQSSSRSASCTQPGHCLPSRRPQHQAQPRWFGIPLATHGGRVFEGDPHTPRVEPGPNTPGWSCVVRAAPTTLRKRCRKVGSPLGLPTAGNVGIPRAAVRTVADWFGNRYPESWPQPCHRLSPMPADSSRLARSNGLAGSLNF